MTAHFGRGGGACRCQECRDEHIRQGNAAVARRVAPRDELLELRAEVKRLESEASAQFTEGMNFGRQEARKMVEEFAQRSDVEPGGWESAAELWADLAQLIWPDPKEGA